MTLHSMRHDMIDLINILPEKELYTAFRFLEFLAGTRVKETDPLLQALRSVPYDDEPLSDEQIRNAESGRQRCMSGKGIPLEEIEIAD